MDYDWLKTDDARSATDPPLSGAPGPEPGADARPLAPAPPEDPAPDVFRVPLVGDVTGPFLRTDAAGRPQLHVYRVVSKIDRTGRANRSLRFVALAPWDTDESTLAAELPCGTYSVQVKRSNGTFAGGEDVSLGGDDEDDGPTGMLIRPPAREVVKQPDPVPQRPPLDMAQILELSDKHRAEVARITAQHREDIERLEGRHREALDALERRSVSAQDRLRRERNEAQTQAREAESQAREAETQATVLRVEKAGLAAQLDAARDRPAAAPGGIEEAIAQLGQVQGLAEKLAQFTGGNEPPPPGLVEEMTTAIDQFSALGMRLYQMKESLG